MAFDPSTATPFDPATAQPAGGGFDPTTAQPVAAAPPAAPLSAGIPGAGDRGPRVAAAAPPAPKPGFTDYVTGAVEAGLNLVTQMVGGTVGMAAALPVSAASLLEEGQRRLQGGNMPNAMTTRPVSPIEVMNEVGGGVTSGLKRLVHGPKDLQQPDTPDTPLGQEYTEKYVQPALETLGALGGHMPELGAIHEMAKPATEQVSRAVAPAANAVADAATRGVGKVASKALGVDPELAKVAQIAGDLKHPIDVAPDQVVQNAKFSKLAGQASRDVPLSGSKTVPNQKAFTKNVIDILNPEETVERLTPEVFNDAMNRSGQGIGDITAKTPVPVNDLQSGLDSLRDHVNAKETPDNAKIVNAYVDEIAGLADDKGVIDGTALKKLNSEIGLKARNNVGNDLGSLMNDLQGVIQDGVEKNITDPADAKALRDFRRQYAYGKILEPTVAKTIDGMVSPASLMQAATSTKLGKHLMANAKGGALGDLAKVGQLIKEPGSSLTAERSAVYATLGGAGYLEPHTAAGIYGAANLYNRAGPKLTRAMVGKRAKPVEPPAAEPPGPPPEPTTSPGAGGPSGGGGGGPPAGPLGDLTPDWGTTPGAGGGPPRGGHEPGLVPSLDDTPPTTGSRRDKPSQPLVPGKPGIPDTIVSGRPGEQFLDEKTQAALNDPGAIEARRQQAGAAAPAARAEPTTGPSLAETNRLLAENPSPEVRKVLEDHAAAVKQAQRDRALQEEKDAKAAEVERTARTTTDVDLRNRLLAEADKIRGTTPIPKGEVTEGQPPIASDAPTKPIPKGETIEGEPAPEKVPVGKVTEGQPEIKTDTPKKIPAGKATELSPEEEAKWRKTFGLGEGDATRAKAVATALAHDEKAVEAAAVQHENSPRAFDREIERINEEAKNANESQRAAEGSESPADAGSPPVRPGEGGGAPVRAGEADRPVPAAESGAGGKPEPEPAATVRAADEQSGADSVPAAGRGQGAGADTAGGQAAGGAEGKPRLGESAKEVWDGMANEVVEPGRGILYPTARIIGGGGDYKRGPSGKLERLTSDGRGARDATKAEEADFHDALEKDQVQVLVRSRWGGSGNDASTASRDVRELHSPSGNSFKQREKPNGTDAQPDNQPGDLQQKAGEKSVPKDEPPEEVFSAGKEETQGKPVGSPEALDAVLRDKFGDKLIDGLHEQGLLKYALARDEAMTGSKGGVKAIMRQKAGEQPAATLYFDRITADRAPSILMHELGEHFGIVRMLGGERYRVILNELENLRDSGHPEVSAAWDHVRDNYVGEHTASNVVEGGDVFMREVAARLVETHPDLPWVRRLINEIRAFFYEKFGTTLGTRVDANLLRGLAASALRKASAGDLAGQRPTARQFKPFVPSRTSMGSANRPPPTQ